MLRAPLAFFHTNPTGRVLNRFSKDQSMADEVLPQVSFDALQSGFMVIGAFVLVSWVRVHGKKRAHAWRNTPQCVVSKDATHHSVTRW